MPIEITASDRADSLAATKTARRKLNFEIRFGAPKITIQQRITFTERLALLLETGVSLLEALTAMHYQAEPGLLTDIIESLATSITEGHSFSHALGQHPAMFSPTYVNLVGAAESGGFLPQVLNQLLKMDEKESEMRGNMKAALSYPVFLVVFSVAVIVFVLVFIFPKFEALFASIHDQLPVSTRFLMWLSMLVRQHWALLLLGIGAGCWSVWRWLGSLDGKLFLDRMKMSAPLLKDIYTQIYLSQTLGVLGLSLTNGVPLTTALKASQGVVNNVTFSRFLDGLRAGVNEGRGLAVGFNNSPLIPPLVRQMISTGEQTGSLGLVMTRIAVFYERELAKRITILSRAVEPIMLVVMGIVVGLIVVSLILPIFKLSRAVH